MINYVTRNIHVFWKVELGRVVNNNIHSKDHTVFIFGSLKTPLLSRQYKGETEPADVRKQIADRIIWTWVKVKLFRNRPCRPRWI